MEGLAIIDDQASITIVDQSIINALDIDSSDLKPTTLCTTTIQGTSSPEPCKVIAGLTVSSIDGTHSIPLPLSYINKSYSNAQC